MTERSFEGMKDSDIELAMQTRFDRVASMIFVRTMVTDASGTPPRDGLTGDDVVEDDDCDWPGSGSDEIYRRYAILRGAPEGACALNLPADSR